MEPSQLVGLLALFAGLTIFFLLYAIYAPIVERKDETKGYREGILDDEETTEPEVDPNDSIGRYVRPILNNFLPQLPHIPLSEGRRKGFNNLIVKSGNPWNVNAEEFIGLQIAFSVMGALLSIIVVATGQLPTQIPPFVFVIVLTAMGYAIPYSKYNSAKQARTKAIEKELPEALDLLTITIATGQVFEFALESVTQQLPEGLLKNEFGKVVVELQAGSTLERSFKALTRRFESEDLESFTKAVIQATKLGSDVSETLTNQADYVRSNYEARLERMIARLETTMFIPLIMTMLPAFMLILIAPTMNQLSGYL
jgi:Flp pilus assembly protein TadB